MEAWVAEQSLAEGLGIALDVVVARRGLEGADWRKGARHVQWSADAASRLLEALAGATVLPVRKSVVVTVTRSDFPNRKIMHAVLADGLLAVVRVADARLFIPGMEVLAEHYEGATWDYRGNPALPEKGCRLPRRKGVW